MKKQLAALISAVAVTATTVPVFTTAYAANDELYNVLMDYAETFLGEGSGSSFEFDATDPVIKNIEDIEISVDMKAKEHGDSEWKDKRENNTYSAGTNRGEKMDFDYMAVLDMSAVEEWYGTVTNLAEMAINVSAADDTAKETMMAQLDNSYVENGEFTVTVDNPDGMTLPDAAIDGGKMDGFSAQLGDGSGEEIEPDADGRLVIPGDPDDEANGNLVYIEADRTGNNSGITITIGTEGKVSHKALAEALKYDIVLTYEGVEASAASSYNTSKDYKLVGTVEGKTPIYVDATDDEGADVQLQVAELTYTGVQDTTSEDLYDDPDEISETVRITTGSAPGGGGTGTGGGGTSGSWPGVRPTATPAPPSLNDEDHFAYIVGYPDGSIQPEGTITRAEVATIFFRLLTDTTRAVYWSTENDFSDVTSDQWYNNAISTMAKAGIITGYDDGTFKPNNVITRAEFAAIAARFDSDTYSGEDKFTDIGGHWASEYINRAAEKGWINGYEDGTFKPDQNITRAEAMTLVNNVLNRHVQADGMLDGMATWTDNTEDKWYYTAVQEATNSHTYERLEDGVNEQWIEITENPDWTALENEAANANSAG